MRHASTWLWGLAQYGAAVFLVWQALGGSGRLLQAMAIVVLFLWAGLEAFRALARLLEAFSGHSCGDCGGADGGGPEEHPPITVHDKPERKEWRN